MELKELYTISQNKLSEIIKTENPDFRLEQAEYNKHEKVWEVVVSFLVKNQNQVNNPLSTLAQLPFDRIYKKIKINENKEIEGLYIFENQQ